MPWQPLAGFLAGLPFPFPVKPLPINPRPMVRMSVLGVCAQVCKYLRASVQEAGSGSSCHHLPEQAAHGNSRGPLATEGVGGSLVLVSKKTWGKATIFLV